MAGKVICFEDIRPENTEVVFGLAKACSEKRK